MSRSGRRLATVPPSAMTVACGSTASSTAPPPAPTVAAVASPVATSDPATPAPTPSPTAAASAAAASDPPSVAPGALGGALPAALWGTWQLKGTTGYWVFTAHRASRSNEYGTTMLGVGASGNERSLGPRLDDSTACQKVGLYHWRLVSPKELMLTPVKQDPCPRGQALVHADFIFSSSSTSLLS